MFSVVVNNPFTTLTCLWSCHILLSHAEFCPWIINFCHHIIVLVQNWFYLSNFYKVAFVYELSVAEKYLPEHYQIGSKPNYLVFFFPPQERMIEVKQMTVCPQTSFWILPPTFGGCKSFCLLWITLVGQKNQGHVLGVLKLSFFNLLFL